MHSSGLKLSLGVEHSAVERAVWGGGSRLVTISHISIRVDTPSLVRMAST